MKLSSMVATALVAASIVVVGPAPTPANAGNPSCMTRSEYRKIHNGMRLRRVNRIVGGAPFEKYNTKHNSTYAFWHHCPDNDETFVHFQDNSGDPEGQPRLVVYKNWDDE